MKTAMLKPAIEFTRQVETGQTVDFESGTAGVSLAMSAAGAKTLSRASHAVRARRPRSDKLDTQFRGCESFDFLARQQASCGVGFENNGEFGRGLDFVLIHY